VFGLQDVDRVARSTGEDSNDVLAVLALLSRPHTGFLRMQYLTGNGEDAGALSNDEVVKQLRAWWREKTMTEASWREWADRIQVTWVPSDVMVASSAG